MSNMVGNISTQQQDVQAEATKLIAAHTSYFNLDEDALGKDLAGRMDRNAELVRAVFSQLSGDDKLEVGRVMIGAMSDEGLRDAVFNEDGRKSLMDVNRWLANNSLTGDGRANAALDKGLRERIGVALTRTDDVTMIAPPLSSSSSSKPERTSDAGVDFIKRHEGFVAQLYNDAVGNATIGYGHLLHKGAVNDADKARYGKGISDIEATEFLRADLAVAESAVRRMVTVPLTQNQFDALVSFTFNLGGGALQKSTLLRELNKGNYDVVPDEMLKYNKANKQVFDGLTTRRTEEGELFKKQ